MQWNMVPVEEKCISSIFFADYLVLLTQNRVAVVYYSLKRRIKATSGDY